MAFKGWLIATIVIESSLSALPEINSTKVLDVYDYFKSEDNVNFIVTESGDYLVI
jgi:hypothetical protein